MEHPGHGGPVSTSAGDEARLHRLLEPAPPPSNVATEWDATLVKRRDELLCELHEAQIHLNLILQEIVEIEYAMAARSAPAVQCPPQECRHRRAPSATTSEDAPLHQPSACPEHPPRSYRNLATARPPPLYSHVEQSPSPTAITTSRYQHYCRSPSKQTLPEEALVLEVANVGVRPGSEFPEVIPEHKHAVAEPKTSSGVKRRMTEAIPPDTSRLVKKLKPFECQVNSNSQSNLDKHLVGLLQNVEGPDARNKLAEINTKATPNQRNSMKDGESLRRGGKENVPANIESWHRQVEKPHVKSDVREPSVDRLGSARMRWFCNICHVRCKSESEFDDHRESRRHMKNTDSLRAHSSESEQSNEDDRDNYCRVCNLQCSSKEMLLLHLGGRRHREALKAEWGWGK